MLDNRQYHDAMNFFSKILETHSTNIDAINGFAEGQHRSGDPMNAIKSYEKSLNIHPNQPKILIQIGNIYYYNNHYSRAELSYKESAKLDPSNPKVFNNIGSVLKEQGKMNEAIPQFKKAVDLDSQYALPCRNLGDIFLRQGKSSDAVYWMEKAVGLEPGNMRGQYWLGKAFYISEQFDFARDQFLSILEQKPNLHSVHHDLGLAYFGMRNYKQAIQHGRLAIHGNHSVYIYYISLSRFFISLHDEENAMAILDSAHQYDRSIPEVWIAKGDIHKSSERYEDALRSYKIASSYDSKNWKGYYKQGVVQYYLGQLNEAHTILELANEMDSTQSSIHHFLGLVYLGRENAKKANTYLLKASQIDSFNANILFHLGQSFSHLNNHENAKLNFVKSLNIEPNNSETYML